MSMTLATFNSNEFSRCMEKLCWAETLTEFGLKLLFSSTREQVSFESWGLAKHTVEVLCPQGASHY